MIGRFLGFVGGLAATLKAYDVWKRAHPVEHALLCTGAYHGGKVVRRRPPRPLRELRAGIYLAAKRQYEFERKFPETAALMRNQHTVLGL